MIEVIQADRNLAHDIYEGLELYQEAGAAAQGLFDNGALIRQIAAHRQQAEDAMRERCAEVADGRVDDDDFEERFINGWNSACHFIATAIRATQARPAEQRG